MSDVSTMTTASIMVELARLRAETDRVKPGARDSHERRIEELEAELDERGRDVRRPAADAVAAGENTRRRAPAPVGAVPAEDADARVGGHLAVIESRLGTLRLTIEERDWDGTECQYDRVLSAVGKLGELLRGER